MEYNDFEKNTAAKSVTNIPTNHIDLSIGHYGFEHTNAHKAFVSGSSYPTYRLHFILKGQLTMFMNGQKTVLKKNHCFLLRPDIDTGYLTDRNAPACFYWVSFSGNNSKEYVAQMGFGEKTGYLTVPAKYAKKLHDAFYENFERGENADETLTDVEFTEHFMQIVRLLHLSSVNAAQNSQAHTKSRKKYVELALEYVNEHYADPSLCIGDVAKTLFLHENYLSKLFKNAMGITFGSYLTQKRIEYAASLMEQGHTSVTEIASLVGYADPLYFSKVYKKYNRISPSENIKKFQPPRS